MDAAMELYAQQGHRPLYVWGGGHSLAGTHAFVDASAEVRRQCAGWEPDFLVMASATGSTQAGFAIGFADTRTRVLGISSARDAVRGGSVVRECIDEYLGHFSPTSPDRGAPRVEFLDEWTDGGYERTSGALLEVVRTAARAGVYVDPTYSGKALRGLVALCRRGDIARGSRVLFWHSGGLMNLQACELAGGTVAL
jgi:1-aminocyclopropane-1-carboxylate deaminase/D-cysteine desulfhydrase-like pyridoxal-dependent ACC family enzyme